MSRRLLSLGAAISFVLVLAGCHPQQPFYFGQRGELAHYRDMATEIEYPDVCVESLDDVTGAMPPLLITNTEAKEPWDLTLEEAVHNALCNAKVMRQIGASVLALPGGQGPSAPDFVLRSASIAPTIYDPAITESDPRYGVEGALSAFDAQLSSSLLWEKRDTPVNTLGDVDGVDIFAQTDKQDLGTFQARLQKTNVTGGTAAISHNVRYTQSNSPLRRFPSDWQVNVEAEIRQPLLQGAGVTFNRIAGPSGFPGFNQGVMIARINTDIALTNFEGGVRNLVSDVENAYWELYFTYRNLEAVQVGIESALQTWRKIWALAEVGARGGEAEKEAQAREQYFLFRASVERALLALYRAEANLRYMMGIAVADGRLIRPVDEPTTGKVSFDWYAASNEALVRSVDLREQRWTIKRRELELIAAKNYLLPRLDGVARYRWLGLGDDLIGKDETFFREFAYNEMLDGDYQEWALGLDFRMTLGFRREMANVRNAQLLLARDRAILQEQELELSHQLGFALRDLDANYVLTETNFNRRVAAQRQVEAVEAAYRTDTVTLDVLLNAQRLLAQAMSDYFRSLVDYNKTITLVHFRKNSLLEYNGVYLTEGPWPQKAYFDACRLARSRDAAIYMDYGMTLPRVVSRGAICQQAGDAAAAMPAAVPGPEVVPTPPPAGSAPKVPVVPKAPAATQTSAAAPNAAPAPSSAKGSTPTVAKGYDLGQMNLEALAQPAAERPAAQAVQPVSYQQPAPSPSNAPAAKPANGQPARQNPQGWTSASTSPPRNERLSSLPPVESASSTPGWARAQH